MTGCDPQQRRPPRKWLRSRACRTSVALLAVLLSLYVWIDRQQHRQLERLHYFNELGASFQARPTRPAWLNDLIVTVFGKAHAEGFSAAAAVILDNTQVTDSDLQYLKGFHNLDYLSLVNTEVTDAGLEHLSTLTSLHEVHLADTRVTDEGVERLRSQLPDARIIH